ncbi:TIGR03749 family integrating conjugative element protein [Testudinibacter sp. P80/BLE/0925]|uniref:TIGR03749 family integrating conjugative element protein n=1 Tax=Testudinibacter sp. TW-1 TaxID=3417757 RepID=UPI003D362940
MKQQFLFGILGLFTVFFAQAEVLVKWQRTPIPISLSVDNERIIFVDRNVKVGYPPILDNKLRIQNAGGALYLKPTQPFEKTRLQLQDMATGEIILLDVQSQATTSNVEARSTQEPIRILYDVAVESNRAVKMPSVDVERESLSSASASINPKPSLPIPAALTRYAAQSLYAPLRTVEPLEGVRRVATRLPKMLTTLLPAAPITATPLESWQLGEYVVTAIRLKNRSATRITLDPRDLQGRFYAATFQHQWLGINGTSEDTTTLYLITVGSADKAVIPAANQQNKAKPVKKTVKKMIKTTVNTTQQVIE